MIIGLRLSIIDWEKKLKREGLYKRFNRVLSEAFISKNRYLLAYDIEKFNKKLIDWLLWYNTRRPHWSIGLISPLRYIINKLPVKESQMCWTSTNIDYLMIKF